MEVRRVNPVQVQLVSSKQCVWTKTHAIITPLQQIQFVFVVKVQHKSERNSLLGGEQMAVSSGGHALQGRGPVSHLQTPAELLELLAQHVCHRCWTACCAPFCPDASDLMFSNHVCALILTTVVAAQVYF